MFQFHFQQFEKKWDKPGEIDVQVHEGFVSSHPGEDRDSDSDEETKVQLPTPIEDEPVEDQQIETAETNVGGNVILPVQQEMETEHQEPEFTENDTNDNQTEDTGMEEENDAITTDTGEVENDE